MGEELNNPPASSEQSIFEQEVSELKEMMDMYETLKPHPPNRAQRRAMSKNARKMQKRNLS